MLKWQASLCSCLRTSDMDVYLMFYKLLFVLALQRVLKCFSPYIPESHTLSQLQSSMFGHPEDLAWLEREENEDLSLGEQTGTGKTGKALCSDLEQVTPFLPATLKALHRISCQRVSLVQEIQSTLLTLASLFPSFSQKTQWRSKEEILLSWVTTSRSICCSH